MLDLPETVANRRMRLVTRVKNYLMLLLLYCSSSYHFIFSFLAMDFNPNYIDLFDHDGIQTYRLRSNLLPVYGFETFSVMTCIMLFDYGIRKFIDPQIRIRHFLDAYLFSQLAYVGFIHRLVNDLNGIHAFVHTVFFFALDIPMLCISFPLSVYLFQKRLKKVMLKTGGEQKENHQVGNRDSRVIIFDYLVFWSLALAFAVVSYRLYP